MSNLEIFFASIDAIDKTMSIVVKILRTILGMESYKKKYSTNTLNSLNRKPIAQSNGIITQQSDREMRNYIKDSMSKLPLIEHNFERLSRHFIGMFVDWKISVNEIETIDKNLIKLTFESSIFSRLEYVFINCDEYPQIKFAKKNDRFHLIAKIEEFGELCLVLNNVTELQEIVE